MVAGPSLDVELLISVAGGLGRIADDGSSKSAYLKDDECLENLKDLQRFLRKDDPDTREAFRVLGELDVARLDLAPMVVSYQDDFELVYNALKVATFLTMPLDPLAENKQIQIKYMQEVKSAFMVGDALPVVVAMLADPLSRHPNMTEKDGMVVQLVLTFFRNLLCVPEHKNSAASGGDHLTHLREELMSKFFEEGVFDILLLVLQHVEAPPFDTEGGLLLEILHETFRGHAPDALMTLAAAPPPPSAEERRRARALKVAELEAAGEGRAAAERKARQQEAQGSSLALALQQERTARNVGPPPSRHSRFGGCYSRHHLDGPKSVVRNNPTTHDFDRIKVKPSTKNKILEEEEVPRVSHALAGKLVEYAGQVLDSGAYTVLMFKIRDELKRREDGGRGLSRLEEDDMLRFLKVVRFFTAFQKVKVHRDTKAKKKAAAAAAAKGSIKSLDFDKENVENLQMPEGGATAAAAAAEGGEGGAPAPAEGEAGKKEGAEKGEEEDDSPFAAITATLDLDCFNLVLRKWREQVDQPNNSEEKDWEVQSASLSVLKEMLAVLDLAHKTGNKRDRSSADRLMRNLLHDSDRETGILQLLSRLIKGFNRKRQPRSQAGDMCEAVHIVLKMLEQLCTNEDGSFQVRARRKKRAKKKADKARALKKAEKEKAKAEAKEAAAKEAEAAKAKAAGEDGAASGEAAADGAAAATADGEGAAAAGTDKETPLKGAEGAEGAEGADTPSEGSPGEGGEEGEGAGAEEYDSEDEDSEEEDVMEDVHKSLDFHETFTREMSSPLTTHVYMWLLEGWEGNSTSLNHCIATFIARICSPGSTGAMTTDAASNSLAPTMYQLSVLGHVCRVLNSKALYSSSRHDDLRRVLTKFTQGFFQKLLPPPPPPAPEDEEDMDSGPEGEEVVEARHKARLARKEVEAAHKVDRAVGDMLFVEVCFWKNRRAAMEIRDRYHCTERELGKEGALKGAGVGGGMGLGLGDDEGANYDGMVKATRKKKKELFSEAQLSELKVLYDQFKGKSNYLSTITQAMTERGHEFSKNQISRELKKWGLGRVASEKPAKGRRDKFGALGSDDETGESDGGVPSESEVEDDASEGSDGEEGMEEEAGAEGEAAGASSRGGRVRALEEDSEDDEPSPPEEAAAAAAVGKIVRAGGPAAAAAAAAWLLDKFAFAESAWAAAEAEAAGEAAGGGGAEGEEAEERGGEGAVLPHVALCGEGCEEDAAAAGRKGMRGLLKALGLRRPRGGAPKTAWAIPGSLAPAGLARARACLLAALAAAEEAAGPPPEEEVEEAEEAAPRAKGRALYKNKRKAAKRARVRSVMRGRGGADDGEGDMGLIDEDEDASDPPPSTKRPVVVLEEEGAEEGEGGGGGAGFSGAATLPRMMAKRRRLMGAPAPAAAAAAVGAGGAGGLDDFDLDGLADELADELEDELDGGVPAPAGGNPFRRNVLEDSDSD